MKNYLLLLILFTCTFCVGAQQPWKLSRDEDGIKVFLANNDASKFKNVKVQCTLNGTIPKLLATLRDVKAYPSWLYKTKQAYMLKQSPSEFAYYLETEMPWPVKNRDGIYSLKINYDTTGNKLLINGTTLPQMLPSKDNIVRISAIKTSWNVTEQDNHITIEYLFQVDPGGSLPAWVANAFADKGPFETFKGLAALLKKS